LVGRVGFGGEGGVGEDDLNFGEVGGLGGASEDFSVGGADEGVATLEGVVGVEGAEELAEGLAASLGCLELAGGELAQTGMEGDEASAEFGEVAQRVPGAEKGGGVLQALLTGSQSLSDVGLEVGGGLIEIEAVFAEEAGGFLPSTVLSQAEEFAAGVFQMGESGAAQAAGRGGEGFAEGVGVGGEDFGGGTGGGGAEVGNEVADGEVDFVADGTDNWEGTGGDGVGENFFVELPEVFEAATTASEDQDIEGELLLGVIVEGGEGLDHFSGGSAALDADGEEDDFGAGAASLEDVEEIAQSGTGGGGDEAEAAGEGGQGAFALGSEESGGGEFFFEGGEAGLEGALADFFDEFDDHLDLAAGFVNGDFTPGADFEAIAEFESAQRAGISREEDAGELRGFVFEGEVVVAGGLAAVVGNLAFDPDEAEGGFEGAADAGGDFADGENFGFGGSWLGWGAGAQVDGGGAAGCGRRRRAWICGGEQIEAELLLGGGFFTPARHGWGVSGT
jgi:hypothetical protein